MPLRLSPSVLTRSRSWHLVSTVVKRYLSSEISGAPAIQNVTVFGGGSMGAGIAQVAAYKGFNVTLCDSSEKALDNGRSIIQQSVARIAKATHPDDKPAQNELVSSVFDRIRTTTDPVTAVNHAELVVEAISEDIKLKQDLFKLLDGRAVAECIFATNTNSLSVSDISSVTSLDRRKRFGGLHFYNPVAQMQLVEVIKTDSISLHVFNALSHFCKRLDKMPVTCKDTPGFIVNRLLIPYMFEAIRMAERGDATPQDIDTAMKLGAGYPMGPIELADYVGLDTLKHILDSWRGKSKDGSASIPVAMLEESTLLNRKVVEGKLGHKTGEGLMKY